MDRQIMRRASAIGVGLLLASSVGASAQQTVGGYTWEPFQPSDTTEFFIDGVIPMPDGGLAAYGERHDEVADGLAIWMSAGDGLTWTETVLEGEDGNEWDPLYSFHGRFEGEETFSVASHGDGLVAARTVPGKTKRTFILTSPDGIEWTIADRLKNVHVDRIMSTSDGLVMHGLDFRKAKGFGKRLGGYPTVWTSDDAVAWEAHEITKPIYKPDDDFRSFGAVVRSDDGTWMARGLIPNRKGFNRPSIWTADGDLAWSKVTPPVVNDAQRDGWRLFDSTPAGFLFISWFLDRDAGAGEAGLWLTPDGAAWEQVLEHDIAATLAPGPELAVSTATGAIAWAAPFVWTELSFDDGKSQIQAGSPMYTSSDGLTWEHDPATDVLEGVWPGSAHAMPDGRVLLTGRDVSGCQGEPLWCAFESEAPDLVLIGTPA